MESLSTSLTSVRLRSSLSLSESSERSSGCPLLPAKEEGIAGGIFVDLDLDLWSDGAGGCDFDLGGFEEELAAAVEVVEGRTFFYESGHGDQNRATYRKRRNRRRGGDTT